MGYWIRSRNTSSMWPLSILLLVGTLIAGLLGMHALDGHGSPTAGAVATAHHARSAVPVATGAPEPAATADHAAGTTVLADAAHHADTTGLANYAGPAEPDRAATAIGVDHGCADCAAHDGLASSCVLAPVLPAVLPGAPSEDVRVRPAPPGPGSPASATADPRPPDISALCISRR